MSDPVVVTPSIINTQLSAGLRQVALVLAGAALSKVLPAETVAVLLSNDTLNAAVTVIGVGAGIWGQWKTRKTKQDLVQIATLAPDKIAVVKEPGL